VYTKAFLIVPISAKRKANVFMESKFEHEIEILNLSNNTLQTQIQ